MKVQIINSCEYCDCKARTYYIVKHFQESISRIDQVIQNYHIALKELLMSQYINKHKSSELEDRFLNFTLSRQAMLCTPQTKCWYSFLVGK